MKIRSKSINEYLQRLTTFKSNVGLFKIMAFQYVMNDPDNDLIVMSTLTIVANLSW